MRAFQHRVSERGFSMVELLVAMLIGLIGMIIIFQVFEVSEGSSAPRRAAATPSRTP